MPNQASTKSAFEQCEIITQNLTYIDSLSSLVIDSQGACTSKDDIDNIMLVVGMFQREAQEANNSLLKLTKGAL